MQVLQGGKPVKLREDKPKATRTRLRLKADAAGSVDVDNERKAAASPKARPASGARPRSAGSIRRKARSASRSLSALPWSLADTTPVCSECDRIHAPSCAAGRGEGVAAGDAFVAPIHADETMGDVTAAFLSGLLPQVTIERLDAA
jgi:hypothetical protein